MRRSRKIDGLHEEIKIKAEGSWKTGSVAGARGRSSSYDGAGGAREAEGARTRLPRAMSFRRKLLLSFLLVALLPLAIAGFTLLNAFRARVSANYQIEAGEQLDVITNSLTDSFDAIDDALQEICSDTDIQAGMLGGESAGAGKVYPGLYGKTRELRSTAVFDIYDSEGFSRYSTAAVPVSESLPTYWGILKMAIAHPGTIAVRAVLPDEKNYTLRRDTLRPSETAAEQSVTGQGSVEQGSTGQGSGEQGGIEQSAAGQVSTAISTRLSDSSDTGGAVLQLARCMMQEDECIGYVVATLDYDSLSEILSGEFTEGNTVLILDRFWNEIFSSRSARESEFAGLLRERRMEGEPLSQEEDGLEFRIAPVGQTGLYALFGRQQIFTEDVTRTFIRVLTAVGVLCVITCVIAAFLISRSLTRPIETLTETMDKVRDGDLSARAPVGRRDELGVLAENFNSMTREIGEYTELKMRQQKELNERTIKMMQAQLNPHFLYNTLDSIKWIGKANHIPELSVLASGLAKILRMSISEKRFVPLRSELEMVEYYMEIQKIRLGGSVSYDAEVPDELEHAIVPKLVIQPVVENAVIHGLRDQEEGSVFLNIYTEVSSTGSLHTAASDVGSVGGSGSKKVDGIVSAVSKTEGQGEVGSQAKTAVTARERLVIEVTDDGCGMPEEILAALNDPDREKLKGHLGLYNVDTIIRLNFGPDYGVRAGETQEKGTQVRILLPLLWKEPEEASWRK